MFGDVVAGWTGELFERDARRAQEASAASRRTSISAPTTCASWSRRFLEIYTRAADAPFPQDAREQLERSIDAVFDSWKTPSARSSTGASTGSPDASGPP